MARRKGATRAWAGEFGDLFVLTDGVHPVFTDQESEVYPDADQARLAWQSVRRATWAHPDREEVFPPAGAVYDGLVSRVQTRGFLGRSHAHLKADAAAVLADVDTFRRRNPKAAAEISDLLDEYAAALRRLIDCQTMPTHKQWIAMFRRKPNGET